MLYYTMLTLKGISCYLLTNTGKSCVCHLILVLKKSDCCREPYINTALMREVRLFLNRHDWDRELARTGCPGWRLSQVNHNYQVSPLLIEALVIPQSVTDIIITEAVEKFRCRFCPVWVSVLLVKSL